MVIPDRVNVYVISLTEEYPVLKVRTTEFAGEFVGETVNAAVPAVAIVGLDPKPDRVGVMDATKNVAGYFRVMSSAAAIALPVANANVIGTLVLPCIRSAFDMVKDMPVTLPLLTEANCVQITTAIKIALRIGTREKKTVTFEVETTAATAIKSKSAE